MKRIFLVALLALSTLVFAEDFVATNGAIELRYNDGVIKLFAKGAEKPTAILRPTLKEKVTPQIVDRGKNDLVFSLRGENTRLTFRLHRTRPAAYMALNLNASPVTVEWNADAVILPSLLAESVILTASENKRLLPPFLPMYSALLDDGDAMLSILPIKARQDAELSGDLKTLTLHQKNIEDYYFVLTSAKGCWSKCTAPAEVGQEQLYDNCIKPYAAEWRASLPLEQDFIPSGDGIYSTWFVPTHIKKDDKDALEYPPPRVSLPADKIATMSAWSSGFEGSYRYPVEFVDGKLKIFYPRFRSLDRYKLSQTAPVYIYALKGPEDAPVSFPYTFLPAWTVITQFHTMNFGSSPATCATTASMEKIFYQDKSKEQVKEIKRLLDSMQFFVESIRARSEDALVWKGLMLEYAEHELKAAPELKNAVETLRTLLADCDKIYADALPTIKYPPEVQRLSAEVLALANSDIDSEEKENKAKELGRAIRTIGGGQDNLVANMRRISKNICYKAIVAYTQAATPQERAFWSEVFRRTEERMQGMYGHEGR